MKTAKRVTDSDYGDNKNNFLLLEMMAMLLKLSSDLFSYFIQIIIIISVE
jgi:hypothetical protein